MRDCDEIKILLAICPSCHRGEDFIVQQVSWNLRLTHVSFLPNLFLLSWFPACLGSCHSHCTGFSSHSSSTMRAFPKLGFCCAWLLGWAKVVSARLNPRNITIYVGRVCNFLSSVSLQQNLEANSVTVQFYLASKGKYILEVWGQADPKDTEEREDQRSRGLNFGSSFYMFLSPPHPLFQEPALCKLGKSGFCFTWGSWTFLCSICEGFFLPLSFSHHYIGLLFPILIT